MAILTKRAMPLLLIAILGTLVYANTFRVPFQWDEDVYLAANPFVTGSSRSIASLRPDRDAQLAPQQEVTAREIYRTLTMRPVGYATFALNHRLHGFAVEGYHIVNLLVHLLAAVLVHRLVVLLFRTPALRGARLEEHAGSIALFTALLFVVHPLQTEAVTYVMQRLASLAALFSLLSVVCFLESRMSPAPVRRTAFLLCSLASAVLAMKTKENAFIVPFLVALHELVLFRATVRERALRLAPFAATLLIIPLTMLSFASDPDGSLITGPASPARASYLLTQLRVVVTYLGMLIVPVNQSIVHEYPLSTSLFEGGVLASGAVIAALVATGLFLAFRRTPAEPGTRLVGLGILWFFFALSVESSFIPLPAVMAEYRVYLPSVGYFLSLVAGLYLLMTVGRLERLSRLVPLLLSAAIVLFAVATYTRNRAWGDTAGLWEEALSRNPSLAGVHLKLGEFYLQQGRYAEAITRLESAVRLGMNHPRLHFDRAVAYGRTGRLEDARTSFEAAVQGSPGFADAHFGLGSILVQQERYEEAQEHLEEAVRLLPASVEAHTNLGGVYFQLGRYEDAKRELQRVLELRPGDEDARYNLHMVEERIARARHRTGR